MMRPIHGPTSPTAFVESYDNTGAGKNNSISSTSNKSKKPSSAMHGKGKKEKHIRTRDKDKETGEGFRDIKSMISTSMMTTTAFLGPLPQQQQQQQQAQLRLGRERSGSVASSLRSAQSTNSSLSILRRSSVETSSIHSNSTQQSHRSIDTSLSHHHHHHIRLPSFLKRRKQSNPASFAPESSSSQNPSSPSPSLTPIAPSSSASSSLSSSSSSSSLTPASKQQQQKQKHKVTMVPQHDIHISWPHPVQSGNAFVAGTWSIPGHGPWEKLPMTLVPGTDALYEIYLNVQEVEDVDNINEDGYLHHELLNHHELEHNTSSLTTPTFSKRIARFFGRSRSSSNASTSSNNTLHDKLRDFQNDPPYHHQLSKDGVILPMTRQYRYQFKFVIDDEWKCDSQRKQVQDDQGHWNHELIVDLVEQIQLTSPNRSRSSSLQSEGSVTATTSTPLPAILNHEEDKINSTSLTSKNAARENEETSSSLAPATTASSVSETTAPQLPDLVNPQAPSDTFTEELDLKGAVENDQDRSKDSSDNNSKSDTQSDDDREGIIGHDVAADVVAPQQDKEQHQPQHEHDDQHDTTAPTPDQGNSNQTKNQIKSNQIKSNQIKSNQMKRKNVMNE
ncbi:hypothetical protein BX616_007349 [Lobosporangium transversale]|nr:hypothetical protein BX616_007349 [Lobosporangium transversale]